MKFIMMGLVLLGGSAYSQQVSMYGSQNAVFTSVILQAHAAEFTSGKMQSFDPLGGAERYFSNKWVQGTVTNTSDVTLGKNYTFNFDFVEHELYVQWKDTAIVLNNSYIKSFMLMDDKGVHTYTKLVNPETGAARFFEVLGEKETSQVAGTKPGVRLLKLRTATSEAPNKNSYLTNFNGTLTPITNNKTEYYMLLADGSLQKVKLNKKSFLAVLSTTKYKDKAEAALSNVKSSGLDESSAVTVLEMVNN